MSNNVSQFQSPYLPTSRKFPTTLPELTSTLSKMYIDIAQNNNVSTNGLYQKVQVVTRNTYYNDADAQTMRQSYRQVYTLSSIASGTNNIAIDFPTGSSLSATTSQFVHIYGVANDPSSAQLSVPLPHVNVGTPADGIQLQVDWSAPQIQVITTTANWTGYNAVVVLEYIL